MTLNIEHYPNRAFSLGFSTPEFSVDLNTSVRKKLNEGQQLTNATALKILKQIKWESDIVSLMIKSIVVISLVVLIAGFCIPAYDTALFAARLLVSGLGGGMLGYSINNSLNGFLRQLSQAYMDQSQRASEYINILERSDDEMRVELA